jgi:uncharacterized protein with ParB-like and HNH nuclease domain/predicted transport protein
MKEEGGGEAGQSWLRIFKENEMKAAESQFLPFLNGKKQFVIPLYQRTYSWTREQCEQLWNDIVQATTYTGREGHFIGSIVYAQQEASLIAATIPRYLVIDGQQRLTTLSLFLVALAQAVRESATSQEISHEEISDSYLVNTHGKGELHYKLMLTQSDKEKLIEIIDHPERVTPSTLSSRLEENYLFFVERIRQSEVDLQKLYEGINKLIIVEILLGRDDNPQLIFESLNSTGMDLSQADLIRNYVLMGLREEEQTKLYKDYWYPMERQFHYAEGSDQFDRFMRDYLTLKQGSIPNIDRVYASFKAYQRSQTGKPIRQIVEDLYRYAHSFLRVALLQEEDEDIWNVLNDIHTLKVDVAYPFLLEVYDDYAHKLLSKQDLLVILRLVESYVLRRLICGIPTHGLNKVFVTLAKEIEKEHYLESVQAAFLAKARSGRFPRDEEFRSAFVVKDVYNLRIRKYLLSKLENYGQKELVRVENCTIEHILPQNERLPATWREELGSNWKEIQSRYLHTIGNLTLTGYNAELSDRPFLEKRDMEGGFAQSPLRLNRSLAKLEQWKKDEIEKRAQALADIAIKAWPVPTLSAEQINQYQTLMHQIPYEVVGPTRLPLVGSVPAGFKIIRRSEKRFHLSRLVENDWVQYGNGKKAWYAISWHWAGNWAREKDHSNEMPLGVGGEMVSPLPGGKMASGIVLDASDGEDANGTNGYTLNSYAPLQGAIRELFESVRGCILKLDPTVREECKKLSIAYKTSTNFVDVEPQVKSLRLFLNMKFSEIHDPKGLCRDVSAVGHHGNGEIEISLSSSSQLDDAMYLVRQSFEKHWEEDV